jgi:hypothetical protein
MLAGPSTGRLFPSCGGPCAQGLPRRSPRGAQQKVPAHYVVLKVMDYYIAFDDAIARGFTDARNLVLTRHPLPMCDGLMHRGLGEARAIKWYNDVTKLMFKASGNRDALWLRFEDLARSPNAFAKTIYDALGRAAAEDGKIWLKVKSFGTGAKSERRCSNWRKAAHTIG